MKLHPMLCERVRKVRSQLQFHICSSSYARLLYTNNIPTLKNVSSKGFDT